MLSGGKLDLSGRLVLLTLTAVALSGLVETVVTNAIGSVRLASYSLTAILGLLIGVAGWLVLALQRRLTPATKRIIIASLLYADAVVASVLAGGLTRHGVQLLEVLASALGVLLMTATARAAWGSRLEVAMARAVRLTSVVVIAALCLAALHLKVSVAPRSTAMVGLIYLGWFLAEFRSGRRSGLVWSAILLAAIGLSLSRGALVAGYAVMAVALITQSRRPRLAGAVVAVLLFATGYYAISVWPPLHDRFFSGDVSLNVAGLNVNAEGRTHIWSVLWHDIPSHALLGYGADAASARSVALDPAFDQPHNDYLRLLYDFGAFGCVTLGLLGLEMSRGLRSRRSGSRPPLASVAARMALGAVLIVMVTDNPLDYPFVMIPLAALVGCGLGAAAEIEANGRNTNSARPRPMSIAQEQTTPLVWSGQS